MCPLAEGVPLRCPPSFLQSPSPPCPCAKGTETRRLAQNNPLPAVSDARSHSGDMTLGFVWQMWDVNPSRMVREGGKGGGLWWGRAALKSPSLPFGGGKKEKNKNPIGRSLRSKEHYPNIFQLRHENRKQRKNSAPPLRRRGENSRSTKGFSPRMSLSPFVGFWCGLLLLLLFFGELIFSEGCVKMINYPKSVWNARKRQKQKGFR